MIFGNKLFREDAGTFSYLENYSRGVNFVETVPQIKQCLSVWKALPLIALELLYTL